MFLVRKREQCFKSCKSTTAECGWIHTSFLWQSQERVFQRKCFIGNMPLLTLSLTFLHKAITFTKILGTVV